MKKNTWKSCYEKELFMTQADQILEYLKQGHSITPLEGLQLFGTLRLGARCFDLRKAGYDVRSRLIKTASGKRVAQYCLLTKNVDVV